LDVIAARLIASLHAVFKCTRSEFEAAVQIASPRWEEKFLEPEDGRNEA
jgi:hypothetical protein